MANKGFRRFTATGVHDPVAASAATALTCLDPSRTIQSQKAQADINTIVKAFGVTGKLPIALNLPEYGDFTDAPHDYRDALNRIEAAEAAFYTVPAEIRAKFSNDPATFFDAVHNASPAQLKEWGLAPATQDSQVALSPPPSTPPAT